MDWQKAVLKFSEASRQEATTAEENLMRLLMQEIEALLKRANQQEPRRIWTLHKIVGNQVFFYRSSNFQRSANHQELVRSINDGLIGKAIKDDKDVVIFRAANREQGYIQGWDDCKAELIALIRDSRNDAIGVINIESNFSDDFHYNDDTNDSVEQENAIKYLKQIVSIVANHISLVFRNQLLIEGEKSSINLIRVTAEASAVSRAVLQEVIANLARWLNDREKLLRIVVYLRDPGDADLYKRLSNIDLFPKAVSNSTDTDRTIIPSELKFDDKAKSLFGFGLRKFSRPNIVNVFGEDFTNSLLAGSKDPGIYFVTSDGLNDQDTMAKYFIGLILSEPANNNLEVIQTFFDVAKSVVEKHFHYKNERYVSLQNRATIEIYRTILQENSLRIALNKIATRIADETEGRFCMIYLVTSPDEACHSRHNFYLGGAGKGAIDFADIRFNQDSSIVSHVLNNQKYYYHSDFYRSEDSRHLLDRSLREQGLERPEVYAVPLRTQVYASDSRVGVILLFRENSDEMAKTNRPSEVQVKLRLNDWTEYLSTAIYRKQKQTDFILAETFRRLAEIFPKIILENSIKKRLFELQTQMTNEVLPLWREIINPAMFLIYKERDNKIEILNPEILPRTQFEPPEFERGRGLTGIVIGSEEVYEPFIEDFEPYTEDLEYSRRKGNINFPIPDRLCKFFWDSVLGDKRRMYYGRHAVLGNCNYVLLIVGVRQNQFLPYLGYKLSNGLTGAVIKFLEELIENE